MTEPPDEWLRRLFEFEFCPECGGDAEDHEVCLVLGNYLARCKRSQFDDTPEGGVRLRATTNNLHVGTWAC